jgi:DNA gyrase subunit A
VKGVTLSEDPKDSVVGMVCLEDLDHDILVVSEKGFGKRSDVEGYRITNRGGKGVKTINITDKTGQLIAIKEVTDADDLMIINKSGIAIRMRVTDMRVMGRATQGVRVINLKEGDSIASVTKVHGYENGNENGDEGSQETSLESDVTE